MRRRWMILAIAGVLLLSGCEAETSEDKNELSVDLDSAEDTQSKGSTQNNMSADSSQIHITDIEIPLAEGESLSCYTVDNGVAYYAVELPTGDLEINPNAEFTAAMEKEIRSYNWNTKEEELLYKYAEGKQIETSDMGVCNNLLYWKDYPRGIPYRVMGLELNADRACTVLFEAEDEEESGYVITPEINVGSAYAALQQMNDKYITYVLDSDSRNQIYVIDRANETKFMIETERFFNYGLLGEFLIINLSDQVISVNLADGEKNVLLDSCDWYGWIFDSGDETLTLQSGNHIYIFGLE